MAGRQEAKVSPKTRLGFGPVLAFIAFFSLFTAVSFCSDIEIQGGGKKWNEKPKMHRDNQTIRDMDFITEEQVQYCMP